MYSHLPGSFLPEFDQYLVIYNISIATSTSEEFRGFSALSHKILNTCDYGLPVSTLITHTFLCRFQLTEPNTSSFLSHCWSIYSCEGTSPPQNSVYVVQHFSMRNSILWKVLPKFLHTGPTISITKLVYKMQSAL
jgi:hypothetical protein